MAVIRHVISIAALCSITIPTFADDRGEAMPGHAVYIKWCAPCHDPGVSHPGTNALTVKYKGVKPGVLLEWKDLPPAMVKHWVRTGISVMPQFRKTEISDADLDALAKYLSRNTPSSLNGDRGCLLRSPARPARGQQSSAPGRCRSVGGLAVHRPERRRDP